jgi:antitoxin (DNA-binding transcriptional repressor) of toxin-antitoxin stability system
MHTPSTKPSTLFTSREAVRDFSAMVSRVAFGGQRTTITRSGKAVAVLLSPGDLAQLERQASQREAEPAEPLEALHTQQKELEL